MNRLAFFVALALAVGYAVLAFAEARMYQSWERVDAESRDYQMQLEHVKVVNTFAQRLVRRIVADSLHDKALIDLLQHHGVIVTPPGAKPPAPSEPSPLAPAAAAETSTEINMSPASSGPGASDAGSSPNSVTGTNTTVNPLDPSLPPVPGN